MNFMMSSVLLRKTKQTIIHTKKANAAIEYEEMRVSPCLKQLTKIAVDLLTTSSFSLHIIHQKIYRYKPILGGKRSNIAYIFASTQHWSCSWISFIHRPIGEM